jgi:hypothetical protein
MPEEFKGIVNNIPIPGLLDGQIITREFKGTVPYHEGTRNHPIRKLFAGVSAMLLAGTTAIRYIPKPVGTGRPIIPPTGYPRIGESRKTTDYSETFKSRNNQIRINFSEPDFQQKYVTDKFLNDYLVLPFIPREFETVTSSLIKSLNVVASNFQSYHYGGSEDTASLEVRWYGFGKDQIPIQQKCRRLEALSKIDGWNSELPEIVLHWGNDNTFLGKHKFVVEKVTTTYSQFMMGVVAGGVSQDFNMQPVLAIQQVSLRRIADQLTYDEMIY